MAALLFLLSACCSKNPETHGNDLLNEIIRNRNMVLKSYSDNNAAEPAFITVWDFDGTILKGDCSEGLTENGRYVYLGLAEKMIDGGFSNEFRPGRYPEFLKRYSHLDKTKGHLISYSYLAGIFSGADEDIIKKTAAVHFSDVLKKYYFQTSIDIIRGLLEAGIDVYIISASPDFFVKGASASVGISERYISGIRLKTRGGKLTAKTAPPVTFASGKTVRLNQIIEAIRDETGRDALILSGFGNSYATDGDFLKYISGRKYSGVSGIGVMINGGPEPEKYRNRFRRVSQYAVTAN